MIALDPDDEAGPPRTVPRRRPLRRARGKLFEDTLPRVLVAVDREDAARSARPVPGLRQPAAQGDLTRDGERPDAAPRLDDPRSPPAQAAGRRRAIRARTCGCGRSRMAGTDARRDQGREGGRDRDELGSGYPPGPAEHARDRAHGRGGGTSGTSGPTIRGRGDGRMTEPAGCAPDAGLAQGPAARRPDRRRRGGGAAAAAVAAGLGGRNGRAPAAALADRGGHARPTRAGGGARPRWCRPDRGVPVTGGAATWAAPTWSPSRCWFARRPCTSRE